MRLSACADGRSYAKGGRGLQQANVRNFAGCPFIPNAACNRWMTRQRFRGKSAPNPHAAGAFRLFERFRL
jgi:hypothetical protein